MVTVYVCRKCGRVTAEWRLSHSTPGPTRAMCDVKLVGAPEQVDAVFRLAGQRAAEETYREMRKVWDSGA